MGGKKKKSKNKKDKTLREVVSESSFLERTKSISVLLNSIVEDENERLKARKTKIKKHMENIEPRIVDCSFKVFFFFNSFSFAF